MVTLPLVDLIKQKNLFGGGLNSTLTLLYDPSERKEITLVLYSNLATVQFITVNQEQRGDKSLHILLVVG